MWVPPEIKDPVLMHAPTRKSVACFGAASLSSGKFVRSMCEKFDALTFQAFLKKLLRHRSRGKRMAIVLDNAKYHHAVLLVPLLRQYRKVLTLLFLPPYSPQLAPIERVWRLARRMAQPTTDSSPHWQMCSAPSIFASAAGESQIPCCVDNAALFKMPCFALEAMRFSKLVIVTSAIVSAEELVTEGTNGFIVDPRDPFSRYPA